MSFGAHSWRWNEFSPGTSMLFAQKVAPLGWYATADDDAMVRIVSSAGGVTGGSNGMADAIGGAAAVSTDSYTLLTADIPAHTHGSAGAHIHTAPTETLSGGAGAGMATDAQTTGTVNTSSNGAHTHTSVGGGGGHAHTLSLDVKYVDMTRCTKG